MIKEKFLDRNKTYNSLHLIETISSEYESFIYLKLIDFINGREKYIYNFFKDYDRNFLIKFSETVLGNNTDGVEEEFDNLPEFIPSPLHEPSSPFEDTEVVDMENLEKALEVMRQMARDNTNAKILNTFSKRLLKATTDIQKAKVVATGGCSNRKILAVQSRIAKNSHKNRTIKDLATKNKNAKPRCLAAAIAKNIRNKLTQSKK